MLLRTRGLAAVLALALVAWQGLPGGPGTPEIVVTSLPGSGTYDDLHGRALHVAPDDHEVAVYIRVFAD